MSPLGVRPKKKRMEGAAPTFVRGLHDLDMEEGTKATVATKAYKKRGRLVSVEESEGLMTASPLETPEPGAERRGKTVEEIRAIIEKRNAEGPVGPKFIVKPRTRKAIEDGKGLRLKTAISSNPQPQVVWDRSGILLETGNKYSIYNDGDFYYLEVHHMTETDQGFYNCTATNGLGMASGGSEVEVVPRGPGSRTHRRKSPLEPAFIEVLPGKLSCRTGEPLSVECSVQAHPCPSIQWLKDRRPLLPEPGITMSYDGECATLAFAALAPKDAARYTCIATNQAGEARTSLKLLIRESGSASPDKRSGEAPRFATFGLSDQEVSDGEKVTLTVKLMEGSEPLEIVWLHDGVEINDSAGFTYSRTPEGLASLTVADAFPEDTGSYTCQATNKFGTDSTSCNVTVKEKVKNPEAPKIVEAASEVIAEVGDDAELTVTIAGYPPPIITWQKAGEIISHSEKFQILTVGQEQTLAVRRAEMADAGVYRISAENASGSLAAEVKLTVEVPPPPGTPLPPKRRPDHQAPCFHAPPMSVNLDVGAEARLKCSFKGAPLPSVSWYRNGKLVDAAASPAIVVTTHGTKSELVIGQVDASQAGEYLVAIRNPYGEDIASATVALSEAGLWSVAEWGGWESLAWTLPEALPFFVPRSPVFAPPAYFPNADVSAR